jgi:divalent metal cation (Fe/Co/Zn/Cd) transporter
MDEEINFTSKAAWLGIVSYLILAIIIIVIFI